jgi:hypothetical protein
VPKNFIKKYISIHKMCVYNISNFENQIQNSHRETKKRNLTRIVSQKDKSSNGTIHISICLFCFSMCISNLVLKSLGMVNTSLMNTEIFFLNFLDAWKFEF